ncbi:HlyD family secretion protein [Mesobaculum littorinae]|uniref:HlyD family secretion protein n=1 Tax=Mesobaculum littorinae TaxID=2486419 RepID=A0A438AI39_9RHOB|nr:HlyD family secretion protein [Mesobaculum littorinae]RVV98396.1 HlyD family secretion protein [Mesobaculum littorinae]
MTADTDPSDARPDAVQSAPSQSGPAQSDQTQSDPAPKPGTARRKRLLMLAMPLLLVLIGGGLWLFGGRYVSTDNAYIHQPMMSAAPEVGGRVAEVLVTENQHVTAGTPLFRIDPTDYRIALQSAEAQLSAARLTVAKERAAYATAEAQLASAHAIADVQARELNRQSQLSERGVGSQAALDDATIAGRTAENAVRVAERQLAAAAAALGGDPEAETDSLPAVRAALATRAAAQRDLDRTTVRAATDGTVSQIEGLNVGQFVAAGSGIATLVNGDDSWIEANFKETQLGSLSQGQPVTIEVDAYPGLELHGAVESFGSATGSQFSLIPAQNATGNWVKVVQRVPVRIRLDDTSDRPLRDGMSVGVSVDTGATRLDALRG